MASTVCAAAAALSGLVAEQLEHPRDVLDELGAQGFRPVVVVGVVVARREAQPALTDERDDRVAVFVVGRAPHPEERADAAAVQTADLRLQLAPVLDRLDAREGGRERLRAGGLDLRLVHTAGEESADQLYVAALAGAGVARRLLQNPPEQFQIPLAQHDGLVPHRVGRRNLILFIREPTAVGVLVKVLARLAGLIQTGEVWAFLPGRLG